MQGLSTQTYNLTTSPQALILPPAGAYTDDRVTLVFEGAGAGCRLAFNAAGTIRITLPTQAAGEAPFVIQGLRRGSPLWLVAANGTPSVTVTVIAE